MTSIDAPLNQTLTRSSELRQAMGPPPWRMMLFDDGRNRVGLSASGPGTVGNEEGDLHIHSDFNEMWILLAGALEFEIGDYQPFWAGAGDLVISPVNMVHNFKVLGDELHMRLFVAKHGADHSMHRPRGSGKTPLPSEASPPNLVHTRLADLVAAQGPAPWAQEVILDTVTRVNLICTSPGDQSVKHTHPDTHQWWTVLKGELLWEIDGQEPVHARKGDLVFVPAGSAHGIATVGDEEALRYSVTPGKELRRVLPDGSEDVYRPDLTGVPWSLT